MQTIVRLCLITSFLLVIMVANTSACGTGEAGKAVSFRNVPSAAQWIISSGPAYLVLTQKNWSNYYPSPPPDSDFNAYIYVLTSRGVKPNPGYTIRILKIRQLEDNIVVKVELNDPDPRKVYPQIIVYPIAVAGVAKADLEEHDRLKFNFIDQNGNQLATVEAEI